MLKYSLSGQILCGADDCTRGIPAVLFVIASSVPTGDERLRVERAVPVAASLPAGWTRLPTWWRCPTPLLFCPGHRKQAEAMRPAAESLAREAER